MKRKIIRNILLSVMIVLAMSINNIYATNKKMLGDINQDNVIDSRDQLIIMRHIMASARKTHPEWILSGDKFKLADVTKNGKVNNSDMLRILRYIAAKRNPEIIGSRHKDWLNIEHIDLTPDVSVNSIKLNKTKYDFDMNGAKLIVLVATVEPTNATDKTITWKSSNNNVAEVDSNGKVIAKGNGTAIITATTSNEKKADCTITVKTNAKSIALNKTNINLDMSGTKTERLIATVKPETATNKKITWKSNNTKIAIVDSNGNVTAKGNGTTTIIATTENGKTIKCTVNVITNPTDIKLDKSTVSLEINNTQQLTATVTPNTSSNKTVTWSSSNTNIATVDNSGKITAKGNGTATITAKTTNGKTATCKVTVEDSFPNESAKIAYNRIKNTKSYTDYIVAVDYDRNYMNVFKGKAGSWKLQRSFMVVAGRHRYFGDEKYRKGNTNIGIFHLNGYVNYNNGHATPSVPLSPHINARDSNHIHGYLYNPSPTNKKECKYVGKDWVEKNLSQGNVHITEGCICLKRNDILWFVENVAKKGTTVVVFTEKPATSNDTFENSKLKSVMIKKGYSDVSQLTAAEKSYVYK